jgi:hypothetical protein
VAPVPLTRCIRTLSRPGATSETGDGQNNNNKKKGKKNRFYQEDYPHNDQNDLPATQNTSSFVSFSHDCKKGPSFGYLS